MKYRYYVKWEGNTVNYRQNFDTLEEARQAMHDHRLRNSVLTIEFRHDD